MAFYSPDFFKNPIPLHRPLTQEEWNQHLNQHSQLPEFDAAIPHYQLSVIQQNSNFVEIVDRNYAVRGIGTFISLVGMVLSISILIAVASRTQFAISDALFLFLIPLPFCLGCLYLLRKESFHYTHFPIRLNRRNRKVYLWRKEGTQVADWDRIHFFLHHFKDTSLTCWEVRGNLLAADGLTVVDSFPLSSFYSSDAALVRGHFEYFRRYMESTGADLVQVHTMLEVCLPLAARRETWWEGCMRLMLNLHGSPLLQWLLFPIFFLPTSLGRWIAMHTSKIPRWPDWVEAECAVEPQDPYRRDSGWMAPTPPKDRAVGRRPPPRY